MESNLLAAIACPDNLRLAFLKAFKGKSGNQQACRFRDNLWEELAAMRSELLSGALCVGDYHFFRIYDPKERMICAASFRERVLHHAIMNICEPFFERYAIHDSYACRTGKGLHRAIDRAQQFCRKYPWYLKLDIRHYFDSIHHETLLKLVAKRLKDRTVLALFEKILASYKTGPGRGLPIGNLVSQHCANLYLGLLDHAVKEERKVPGYLRYMDDFVLFGSDREYLKQQLNWVEEFLATRLKLDLKDNRQLNRCSLGVPFLGFRIFPHTIRLAPRSRARFARKLRQYEQEAENGRLDEAGLARRVTALVSFTQAADAAGFRRMIIQRQRVRSTGARTASIAAEAGTTMPTTHGLPTATTTAQATVTTT